MPVVPLIILFMFFAGGVLTALVMLVILRRVVLELISVVGVRRKTVQVPISEQEKVLDEAKKEGYVPTNS